MDDKQSLYGLFPRQTHMTRPLLSKAELEITPKLKIPVETYSKTKAVSMPTAKKASKKAPADTSGKVVRELIYRSNQDVNEQILPEDIIDGVQFGGSLVAVSKDDKASLELKSSKGIQILGYYKASSVPHQVILGGDTDVVVAPKGDEYGETLLSAFLRGLIKKERVALARYVKRDGKGPALVILRPHRELSPNGIIKESLYLNTIPFEDDTRNFAFNALPVSSVSREELKIAEDVIDAMDLTKDKNKSPSGEILYDPATICNPVHDHFRSCLIKKGCFDSEYQIPEKMADALVHPYKVSKRVLSNATEQLGEFVKAFPLKRMKIRKGKKRVFGDDVETATVYNAPESKSRRQSNGFSATSLQSISSITNADELFGASKVEIRYAYAENDFRKEVLDRIEHNETLDPERLKLAQVGMKTNIEQFFKDGEDYVERFVKCLDLFRLSCIQLNQAATYNVWFKDFITTSFSRSPDGIPAEISKRIRTENLSLILDLDIVGGVTEGEDHEFTNKYFPNIGDGTSSNIQMTVADVDEDDDDLDLE